MTHDYLDPSAYDHGEAQYLLGPGASKGCVRLSSGVLFNPLHPDPALISIRDIAHGLAHMPRYGGHAAWFYSVARHSLLVSRCFEDPVLRMAGLLHDAEEGLGLMDMPSPVKAFFPDYREACQKLRRVIGEAFGVPWSVMDCELIHQADQDVYIREQAWVWTDDQGGRMGDPIFDISDFLREYDHIAGMMEP